MALNTRAWLGRVSPNHEAETSDGGFLLTQTYVGGTCLKGRGRLGLIFSFSPRSGCCQTVLDLEAQLF